MEDGDGDNKGGAQVHGAVCDNESVWSDKVDVCRTHDSAADTIVIFDVVVDSALDVSATLVVHVAPRR